jgi:hypothetical protein
MAEDFFLDDTGMAYIKPTLAEFRALYPVFDGVADATVQVWIDKGDNATVRFSDGSRADAVILYAAHKLVSQGLGKGAIPAGVTSFKSGTFSATVSDGLASKTGFSSTTYGRDYLALARQFAGPRLAWTPGCV